MAEHYFVVAYDTETSSWSVDDEVLVERFGNRSVKGPITTPESVYSDGEWREPIGVKENDLDWDLSVKLADLLSKETA